MKQTETGISEIIKLWKKNNIKRCEMEFSCGGDSMGDYSFYFHTDNKMIDNVEKLESYFDDAVYKNVEFYVNSDGHYVGESGTVFIELNEDEDGFYYNKSARSEWSESYSEVVDIVIDKDKIDFIENYVSNINGSQDDYTVNYKKDFILNEKLKETRDKLIDEITDYCSEYEIEGADGDASDDWFSFTTRLDEENSTENSVKIENDKIYLRFNKNYTVYRED